MQISNLSDARAALSRFAAKAAKVREQAEHVTGVVINSVEIVGTSCALAYLRARYPSEVTDPKTKAKTVGTDLLVAGIPVSLLVGLTGHVAGFAGLLGKYSEHGHAFGTGALTEYASSVVYKMGDEARKAAAKPATPKAAGYFGPANRPQGVAGWAAPQPYAASFNGPMQGML